MSNNEDEIKHLLYQILDNQQVILEKINKINDETQHMNHHINFVENIYNVVKRPLSFLCGSHLPAIKK